MNKTEVVCCSEPYQKISPGKLLLVRSMAGVMAMATNLNRIIDPNKTCRGNEWQLTKFPIGTVLFCVEYEVSSDLKFKACVLWNNRTYDVFGMIGDFELLTEDNISGLLPEGLW